MKFIEVVYFMKKNLLINKRYRFKAKVIDENIKNNNNRYHFKKCIFYEIYKT